MYLVFDAHASTTERATPLEENMSTLVKGNDKTVTLDDIHVGMARPFKNHRHNNAYLN